MKRRTQTTTLHPKKSTNRRHALRKGLRGIESLEPRTLMAVSIGDYVWMDQNADGVQNEAPSDGVNNVEVKLYTSAGAQIGSSIRTGNDTLGNPGYYAFNDLPTGDYYVTFGLPSGMAFTSPFTGSDANLDSNVNLFGKSNTFSIVAGTSNLSIDAGLVPEARIGTFVWWDQDEDGLQKDVEGGIEGAVVRLLQNGSELNSTVTRGGGQYEFNGLPKGKYNLKFEFPVGFDRASPSNVPSPVNGLDDQDDSDGAGPDLITADIDLETGEYEQSVDQGFYKSVNIAKIGNYVWRDNNSNGLQDEGPAFGVNGVEVKLHNSVDDRVVDSVFTDNATNGNPGYYEFTNVPPGLYYLAFDPPGNQPFTTPFQGTIDDFAIDSDVNDLGKTEVFQSGFVDDLTIDAGLSPLIDLSVTTSVTDPTPPVGSNITYVITVSNASGFSPATGVTIKDILPATGLSYNFDTSFGTYNSATGTWNVGTVAPGTSVSLNVNTTVLTGGTKVNVVQVQTADIKDIDSTPNNAPGVREDDDSSVLLTPSASIGNYVWRDVNNDGVQNEAPSFGVNGVTVTLFKSDGTQEGLPVVTSDLAGKPGFYSFNDINPGEYYVRFTAPAGQVFTKTGADTASTDSNADSDGWSRKFTLASGVDDDSIDAGLRPIDLSLTKSVSDPTPRVGSNVTYTITATNDNGFSSATGVTVQDMLPAGTTFVSFSGAGTYSSSSNIWTIGTIAPGTSASLQIVATVSTGGTKTNIAQVLTADQPDFDSTPGNAGSVSEDDDRVSTLTPSANIGDYVWRDENGDGIQNEPASAGFNGVKVKLYTSAGVQVGSEATTGNDAAGNPGYYLFSDIDPGAYYIIVSAPSDQTFTTQGNVATSTTDSNVGSDGKSNTFTLASGVDDTSIDAGLKKSQFCAVLDFNGSSADSGHLGNIRTYSSGPISVNASGFSRDRATGRWENAYLGTFGGGLGVTDSSEGNGAGDKHTVDNLDGRDNYILFEFNQAVVIDSAYLGYVVTDSDLQVWIGTIPNAFNSHQTLSDTLLAGLYTEYNWTTVNTARLADLNANGILGNVIVIAADTSDTTPEDRFKLGQMTLCTPASQQPASIGDFVWHDINGNGIQEFSEPGIHGAVVTLTGGGADSVINGVGDTFQTTTANSSGAYSFPNLTPGTQYRVAFMVPTGFTSASPLKVGTNGSLDSDGPVSDIIILGSGQINSSVDAGFYKDISVGNFVWNDLDKDGFQDSTEVGFGGVAINLTGTSGSGAAINRTTTTASNGSYLFDALPPGTYQVSVAATNFANGAVLSGYAASPTLLGSDRALDSNTNPSATSPGTLASGSSDLTVDFGFYLDSTKVCVNLYLEGNTSTSGPHGNILTFASGSISAKASAFSRDSIGKWAPAYLGRYGGGLGVTDTSEGWGWGNAHTVDNLGRDNYVMFEFSQDVTIDTAFLGYVSGDSDIKVWIGNASNAFNSHYNLSDAFLNGLGFSEVNLGAHTTRTADINAGNRTGNILVISANTGESTKDDNFKIAELGLCTMIPLAHSGTKFFSVDDDANKTFKYNTVGAFTQDFAIASLNPRGITANVSGSNVWIADTDGRIFNYTSGGAHVANWYSKVTGLQGVTTNGTHIWTVSDVTDRVYYYPNGTTYAHGSSMNPLSSFALNYYNKNPTDLTSDGKFIWVVNEGNIAGGVGDMVYKYSIQGSYLGRWQLDAANARPTGITVDPAGGNKLWIVDNATDRIYEYSGATGCVWGGLIASKSYALAAGNTNPQGIADPPGPSDDAVTLESSMSVNEQYFNTEINPSFNSFNATDVNSDGITSPIDALLIINRLNAGRIGPESDSDAWIYVDVSNDRALSPVDALLVINRLNSGKQSESDALEPPVQEVDPTGNDASGNDSTGSGTIAPSSGQLGTGEGEGAAAIDAFFADYDNRFLSLVYDSDNENSQVRHSDRSARNFRRISR